MDSAEHSAVGVAIAPDHDASRFDRVPRIGDPGSRQLRWAAIISLAVTSAAAMTMSSYIRPAARLAGPQHEMTVASLAALCLSAVLAMASLARRGRSRPASWLDRLVAPPQRAVLWLALAGWLPLVLVVVYYRAEATLPLIVQWINFGFEDKRWVGAAFLLGALAPMIWLTAAARLLAVARSQPPTWRAWQAALFPRDGQLDHRDEASEPGDTRNATGPRHRLTGWRRSRARRILLPAAGLATAFSLAWYFLGPPWYLSQNHGLGSFQEHYWLAGFQAMAHGYVPYIGAAGVQYGPGTEVTSYILMRHVTPFSVVGFRQTWALYQWAGGSVLFAVFFLAYGYARGLAISLLSELVYPALHGVDFQPGGLYGGFFGWANPLRYVGMIALIALLPAVVRRCPSWWGIAAGTALGALWGITSYLAQENLIAGAMGALAVASLLLLSGTSSWPAVRAALVAALAGFLLAWLPVLAYYAVHGALIRFLKLYFRFPAEVERGYGDAPWYSLPYSLTTMFYVLPFLLAVGALLTVLEVRPLRIASGWSRERTRLAVTVIITILLYQGALLKSDGWHMTGTGLMVPAVVVVTASALPRLLGVRRRLTAAVAGAALVIASFTLLPRAQFAWTSVSSVAEAPYLDRQLLAADPRPGQPTTLAARRMGPGVGSAPQLAWLVQLMNQIHAIIGSRTTYVVNWPMGLPGYVYFVADLTPAPIPADKYTTVLNEPQLRAYMRNFRASVLPQTQALVTSSLGAPEARYFVHRYPGARRILLHIGRYPYWILLAKD